MSLINNLKLGQKLALLAAVPLFIMVVFALLRSVSALSLYNSALQLESLTQLSINSSSLVHELQKERGMTAGFLGSKGEKFARQIVKQRQLVDKKREKLNHFLTDFDAASISKKFDSGLKEALKRLSLIEQKRVLVSDQNIQLKEVIAYYTNLNASFLTLVSEVSRNSPNGELAVMTASYANYLQSKERAGIERAVMSNVFARDEFGSLFIKFLSLVVAQDNYMNVFLSLAGQEAKSFYKESLQGEAVEEVDRLRNIARNKSNEGQFMVDPTYWFKMSSARINLLKKVEDHLSQELFSTTNILKSNSFNELLINVIAALLGLIISISLAIIIKRGIQTQLGGEPDYIEQIANSIADGRLDMKLNSEGVPSGVYAAMAKMQQRLSDVIEKDIQSVVDASRNGDLSQRVDLQGKSGFYETLSSGVNDVVDASDNVISDTVRVFGALAQGNLNEKIERQYHGSFNQLKQDANATVDKIKQVIEVDIQSIINAAQAGDLSRQISLDGKDGFFRELSSGINQLIDTINEIFGDIGHGLEAMSTGDLSKIIDKDYQGEFAAMKNSYNKTTSNLQGIVDDIRSSASQISTAANEISQGNTDLSQRTEEQAASLEETASSMEEITSTVKQNADNSRQANQLAAGARDQAQDGGAVIESTIWAMEEINHSSTKIEDIIGVIDEIAFQTNLLALNAAVEAARAGEQGKGFAVVASEVRSLAQRSAAAAKEIKVLIKDSVEKVEEGSRLVDDSGLTLAEIVNSVRKVSEIIAEIAASSNEQSAGIEQINIAITQLDETTQQNAALVEEAAAASESLDDQAKGLNDMTAFFETGSTVHSRESQMHAATASAETSVPVLHELSEPPIKHKEKLSESSAAVVSTAADDSDWEEF
ncbi:MAG: nitrate- and nitrite sensing domain-containing protein [gamma proteobacterium symbiont of Taylorina sp.]|nr:nitrate- and nitrite sensing domain-containing protein [gamma proteobacterium symbiont of Taylorina sp.]